METVGVFLAIAGGLFAFDMLAHRKSEVVSLGNAVAWSLVYLNGALMFSVYLWANGGPNAASLFLAGFVMEKALSVDNLMVFVAIFAYFRIHPACQHRVLHYGIVGAVMFRLIFVAVGAGALTAWGAPVGLLFGLVVLWSAFKMWTAVEGDDEPVDYAGQWYARWAKRVLPFVNYIPSSTIGGQPHFLTRNAHNGETMGTPLLLCLIAIEISDMLFSFDSVPAVIAVTQDPVLVYSAMIFAILGLRQLYFVFSALLRYLTRLAGAIVLVLAFIGIKLVVEAVPSMLSLLGITTPGYIHVGPVASLAVVLTLLVGGVAASILFPTKADDANAPIGR